MGTAKRGGRSLHQEMFWRSRLNAAFRTGLACFMAGVIVETGAQWVVFPLFAYILCLNVVGESTLGKALKDALGVLTGTIQGVGMTMLVMQVLSPKRMSLAVATSCICVSSFIITYPKTTNIMAKRAALTMSSTIYLTAVAQKEKMHEVFFPLRLAGTTIAGGTCGMLALLVPWPQLAIFQALSHARLSARITCDRLRVMADAFCTQDFTQASALHLQAKSLAKTGSTHVASKEVEVGWEVRQFIPDRFKILMQLTIGLGSLQKALAGMELVLQEDMSSGPNFFERFLHRMLKESLIFLTDWACLALRHAANRSLMDYKASPNHNTQLIVNEGNMALSIFDEVLEKVREKMVFTMRTKNDDDAISDQHQIATAFKNELHIVSYMEEKLSFDAQARALFFLFNLKKFVEETKAMLLRGMEKIGANGSKDDGHGNCKPTDVMSQRIGLSYTTQSSLAQGSTSGHGQDDIEAPIEKQKDEHNPKQTLCDRCQSAAIQHKEKNREEEEAEASKHQKLQEWLWHRLKRSCWSLWLIKEQMRDPEQLMTAFKMSLAMALASLLGFWFNKPKGYWAAIILALGFTGPAKGGFFKTASLRCFGTASGCIYGLLVSLATESFPILRLVALIPWVVFTSFLRQSKILGYTGGDSAFNGAIVILTRIEKDSSHQDFAVIRIVEAFLGMASLILVELLVFPRRAASLVKPNITTGLANLHDFAATTLAMPKQWSCCNCGSAIMGELLGMEKQVHNAMKRQRALVEEAIEEPQFWFSTFPASVFMKVIEKQERMAELLHFILSTYEQLRDTTKQAGIAIADVVAPLQSSMLIVEEKVLPTLEFLAKVLEVKSPAPPTLEATLSMDNLMTTNNSGTKKIDTNLEVGPPPFVELDSLMNAESCTFRNSDAFNGYQFGDVAPKREKHLMITFEASASHITHHVDCLLANSTSIPLTRNNCMLACEQLPSMKSNLELSSPPLDLDIHFIALPLSQTLSNSIFLSLGALAFSLKGLLHHTTELEQAVHELLQEENPWNFIDFWDTSKSSCHLEPK